MNEEINAIVWNAIRTLAAFNDQASAKAKQLYRLELGKISELDDTVEKLSAISGKKELTRELVGELIKEIAVTDPENIEIRWNFLDEIIKFITGEGMGERGVC